MNCISLREIWHGPKRYTVPCGKCIACLSNSRTDWIFRLREEHKRSSGSLFVTLTYSEKYCPDQLVKRHLQLFMKRLRKRESARIRFFAVGEYGTKRRRPHYHILLFNCEPSGKLVRDSWKFGIVHIGRVSLQSIAYCTKYIVQPEQKVKGATPPFRLMSRGYGIGLGYLTDAMAKWHRDDDRNYTLINNEKGRLPRYYKAKIWYRDVDKARVSDKSKWFGIKARRKELRWFVKRYGVGNAKKMMLDFRDAALSRIRKKVAFTESLK